MAWTPARDGACVSSPPDLSRAVGRRIAELRRLRGLTQETLAARVGMATKYLQRVESGHNVTLRTLGVVAHALDVAPHELLRPVGASTPGSASDPLASLRGSGVVVARHAGRQRVPVLSLGIAAGYLRAPASVEVLGWAELPGRRVASPRGTFVAQVVGDSMQPRIPRGAWCVFGPVASGSIVGRVVLVEHRGLVDADTGGSFAVKQIGDVTSLRSGVRRVTLEPANRRYRATIIDVTEDDDLRAVAELIDVLGPK